MKPILSWLRFPSMLMLAGLLSFGISHAQSAHDTLGSSPRPGGSITPDGDRPAFDGKNNAAIPDDGGDRCLETSGTSASTCPSPLPPESACSVPVPLGLISRYSLDETTGLLAHDSAGGHHALLSPSSAWSPSDGVVGGALSLHAPGADIGVVANAVPLLNLDQFTYCSWIRPSGSGGGLFSANSGRWRGIYMESADPRRMGALIRTTGEPVNAISDAVFTRDEWHHVCVTYDGSTSDRALLFYRNGAALRIVWHHHGSGVTTATGDYIAEFGARNLDGQRFSGSFDEILIYDRVLSAAEVATLHRGYQVCGAP